MTPAPSPAPAVTSGGVEEKAGVTSAGKQEKGEKLAARTNDAAPSSVVKRSSKSRRSQRQLRIDTSETEIAHPTKTRDTNGK
jgi:hypothetical protein